MFEACVIQEIVNYCFEKNALLNHGLLRNNGVCLLNGVV